MSSHAATGFTPDQQACVDLIADLLGGGHHLPGARSIRPHGDGVAINIRFATLSSTDPDALTRLVFLAHDRCIRVEVSGAAPGCLKIILHRRHKRDGRFWQRHPTIEQALDTWRRTSLGEPDERREDPPARAGT